MQTKIFTLLLLVLILASCNNNQNTSNETSEVQTAPVEVPVPVTPAVLPLYPSDKAQDMISKVDLVDLIFYTANFSININEPNNAKGVSTSIISMNLPPDMSCSTAFGHVSFLGDAEVLAEAELFFQQGCTYLVFQENKKNVYTCAIPTRGIQFFNNILKQQSGK